MAQDEASIKPISNLDRGAAVIDAFARSLPLSPGVYRMLNKKGEPIYIGKARQLQKRVLSYAMVNKLTNRHRRLVAETITMEVTHTRTEAEALMLEANMIRRFMPRYNVMLRDDKSVPYIFLSGDHDFPQLLSHRGPRERKGDYYGPFASSEPVWRTITTLQRVFQLRNCSDAMFATRKRPCLQYHIKRCTAPCVNRVDKVDYAEQVAQAKQFLDGKTTEVQQMLAARMQQAAENMEYELAGGFRDRIRALTSIQSRQDINLEGIVGDVDIIAGYLDGGQACIQVFFIRAGRNYGNKAYFPHHDVEEDLTTILDAFTAQFYQKLTPPREILLSHDVPDCEVLTEALSAEAQRTVKIMVPQRGDRMRIMDLALNNAKLAHARNMADTARHRQNLEKLQELIGLDNMPERVEVFDNSHLSGTNALGVMIVAGPEGFDKKHYRKYNIKGKYEQGDDYAMMREVLTRRLAREKEGDEDLKERNWPDLIIVDGGKGQLSSAQQVLADLQLTTIPLLAIAKGPNRNAGMEVLHFVDGRSVQLEKNDPLLYFLQRIRDEAHRFAITGQRLRRAKTMIQSALNTIPGIGAKRKKALLLHFGSAKSVARAGVDDLMKVEGISRAVAQKIYNYFHDVKDAAPRGVDAEDAAPDEVDVDFVEEEQYDDKNMSEE